MISRPLLSPIARNVLDMALRNNGYHIAVEAPEGWLGADATFAPGRCFVSYVAGGRDRAIVAPSLPQVASAFAEEGHAEGLGVPLPAGACAAFTVAIDALPGAVRRIFELSRSLPTAPLDRFMDKARALPRTTEAERLIVERVGQDIFREALTCGAAAAPSPASTSPSCCAPVTCGPGRIAQTTPGASTP